MRKLLLSLFSALFFLTAVDAQTLLYDQTTGTLSGGILCRKHDAAASFSYDTEGADDFTVPSGVTWSIDSIKAYGFYNTTAPNASKTIVTIYNDNSGVPGTVFFQDTINDADVDNNGSLEPYFQDPIVLTGGTYWLSVKLYTSTTPWYWRRITEPISSYQFLWQNPNGGYAVCTSWTNLTSCLSIADSSVAFRLYGCEGIKPQISMAADTTVCAGTSLVLSTGTANANFQHLWSNNATTTTTTVTTGGVYSVTVLDTSSGCTSARSIDVSYANPIISEPMLDDTTCLNQAKVFSIGACPTCSVLWSTGATINTTSTSAAGNISVTSTDTLSGCVESDTAYLTVIDPGLVVLPGNIADLCDNSEVTLKTTLVYADYLWWDMQNPAQHTDSITVDQDGLYLVTVTDAFGCQASDSVLVVLRPNPTPVVNKQFNSSWNVKLSTTETYSSYSWSNGSTDPTTVVTTNGLYFVTVTNEFGCEGSTFASVVTIGIDENIAEQLHIYPNPASNYIQIEWPNDWVGKSNSTICDASGRLIQTFSATQSVQRIDLSELTSGTYLIVTDSPDGTAKSTIVVQ